MYVNSFKLKAASVWYVASFPILLLHPEFLEGKLYPVLGLAEVTGVNQLLNTLASSSLWRHHWLNCRYIELVSDWGSLNI